MEMSPDYARETAEALESCGYDRVTEEETVSHAGEDCYRSIRHRLTAAQQKLVLECVIYPDDDVRYYLELVRYFGLRSSSFPLDSWKYRDDRVEFRYYTQPSTGAALTFVLTYPIRQPCPS